MKWTFDAIFEHGLLRPVSPQPFADRQRVRVTVEAEADAKGTNGAASTNGAHVAPAAMTELIDALRRSPLRHGGPLPTRDELHER